DMVGIREEGLQADPALAAMYLQRDGSGGWEAKRAGTLLKNPELAKLLELLAAKGAKAFYEGKVAQAIADSARARGGILTAEDLRAYRPRWRDAATGTFRGYRVVTAGPPS